MKASKTALTYYILGAIIMIFGFIVGRKIENDYIFFMGITGLNLMWIMGIQYDLYSRKK